ncbi:hypothetical protein CEXT_343101 [Caerostris extrusa]|uniref:Uncharacterized protein n=1 Tax=Caerostris extrusa TaxID=172846 RepID=A0AAV4SCU1_CAEEX|nr:hypothetical protein CEXT_343101 [Caerostris extrusa]
MDRHQPTPPFVEFKGPLLTHKKKSFLLKNISEPPMRLAKPQTPPTKLEIGMKETNIKTSGLQRNKTRVILMQVRHSNGTRARLRPSFDLKQNELNEKPSLKRTINGGTKTIEGGCD